MAVCASLVLILTKAQRDKFLWQGDSSQRIIFVSEARDQPEPGSFFGERKEPGNEVDESEDRSQKFHSPILSFSAGFQPQEPALNKRV